jgi:tripartite-type tricarboxylate transporter receptor subunit TctC
MQGLTIVIENRPGAGTVIGTEAVAHAPPDGNTILLTAPGFVISPHLYKLNYNPLISFEPICRLVSNPTVIAVNNASPYRTFTDLIVAARAKSGELTVASVGPGTANHIAVEMLNRTANVHMTFIPYPGYAPVVTALLGGHVTSALVDYSVVSEQLKAGQLRVLAAATAARIELLPQLPTVAESGYPDYQVNVWLGLAAPAMTPKESVSELASWFSAAIRVDDVKAKLVAQGLYPAVMCGADFAGFVRKQYDEYGRIIRKANISAE